MPSSDASEIRDRLAAGKIREVLAVRASRIGDLLLTTPALHAFRERWPHTRIRFLTNPYCRDLLQGNRDVAAVVPFLGHEPALGGRRARSLVPQLGDVDLLLALRPRPELALFARRCGIPYLFPDQDPAPADRTRHVVEQGFERLRPLGIAGSPGPLRLEIGDDERERARTLVPAGSGPLVVAHPGCDETIRWKPRRSVRRRVWPVAHWRALLARLVHDVGARVVVSSGSRVEAAWVEHILAGGEVPAWHLKRPRLRDLAACAAVAALVITVDTGPLHVAAAVGTPLVALYGPSPVSYTGPWVPAGKAEILRRDLPCAPCQGRDVRCLRNVCMEEIRVDDVVAACRTALGA